MRFSFAAAVVLALVAVAGPAHAQKRCKKGIPCGNSCISASKTCRIGSGPATRESVPVAPTKPKTIADIAPARTAPSLPLAAADSVRWVAVRGGTVYYRATCDVVQELPPELLMTFSTEAAAQRAQFTRSKVAGC